MAMEASAAQLRGMTVIDTSEIPIGTIEEVYLDGEDGPARWAVVGTGAMGSTKRFIPLASADITSEGVTLSMAKSLVTQAPQIDSGDELAPEQEHRLLRHYGLGPVPDSGGARRAPRDPG